MVDVKKLTKENQYQLNFKIKISLIFSLLKVNLLKEF